MKKFNDELFSSLKDKCISFKDNNSTMVGIAEIALGSAILYHGVSNGIWSIGADLIGIDSFQHMPFIGGLVSGLSGAALTYVGIGCSILKGVGICGSGFALGIPGFILIGGATTLLGAFGYASTDIIEKLVSPILSDINFADLGLISIASALLIDGSRRLIKPHVQEGTKLHDFYTKAKLNTSKNIVNIKSKIELEKTIAKLQKEIPNLAISSIGLAGGALIGSAAATASVTVAGSSVLGGTALALGLISAPLWPVIACGGASMSAAYMLSKKFLKTNNPKKKVLELNHIVPFYLEPGKKRQAIL